MWTYALAVGVVEGLQLHDVGVADDPHNLQFSVLEPLVLQNALDGRIFVGRRQLGLENDAKGPVADYLALGILQLAGLARDAILYLFADYLCIARQYAARRCVAIVVVSPPIRRLLNAAGLFDAMVAICSPSYRWGTGGGCEAG